jgi:hypothetical protein
MFSISGETHLSETSSASGAGYIDRLDRIEASTEDKSLRDVMVRDDRNRERIDVLLRALAFDLHSTASKNAC